MAKLKCPKCAHLNDSAAACCSRCKTALAGKPREHASGRKPTRKEDDALFQRGQVVNNRYTVLDLIGRGGMGCIYKAHDNVLGEDVALKTLLPQLVSDTLIVDRFLNEARITHKLAHPNIVRVHDIGAAGKCLFISMEYVQGDSLRGLIRRQRPGERIPVRQTLHIIDQLCAALEYAHQYTIHRDIKPENVMITEDARVKLMDFGISKLMADQSATSESVVMGTPHYMAPEQQRSSRDVDARADVYSIGVLLYELLTGNMPTGVPRPASEIKRDVPPVLDAIVERCVAPDRDIRFASAAELRAAIRPIIAMLDDGKQPEKALASATLRSPRFIRHSIAACCVIAALVFVSLGLWALERWHASAASQTPVMTALAPERAARFQKISAMAAAAWEAAATIEAPTRAQRDQLDAAETRLREAENKAQHGAATAILAAEEALQYYLAALMAPEDMVFIPPGYIVVDDVEIYVPAFFIDQTEVTLEQFDRFSREAADGWPMPDELRNAAEHYPDYPVAYVSWFDAQAYVAWHDKILPTRAQWARAAYGAPDASDVYPWGEEWAAGKANIQTDHTRPVGSFPDDLVWSGCHDMAGNVMEWTRTRADEGIEAPPHFGDDMLVCGGSFQYAQPLHDAVKRAFETRAPDIGFRCVREISVRPEAVAAIIEHGQ